MGARFHDEIDRPLVADAGHFRKLVGREIRQRVARRDAVRRELARNSVSMPSSDSSASSTLSTDSSRTIASVRSALRAAAAQLVHRVSSNDRSRASPRSDVRDFLERGEALGNEDIGDFLVDVELVHEELAQAPGLRLVLLR
jgi:hypothetical protein